MSWKFVIAISLTVYAFSLLISHGLGWRRPVLDRALRHPFRAKSIGIEIRCPSRVRAKNNPLVTRGTASWRISTRRTLVASQDYWQTAGPASGTDRFREGRTRIAYKAEAGFFQSDSCSFHVHIDVYQCGNKTFLRNGFIRCHNGQQPQLLGNNCTHHCYDGFQLRGIEYQECSDNKIGYLNESESRILAEWRPKEPFECLPVNCGPAPIIEYATPDSANCNKPNKTIYPNVCTHTCDDGFGITPGTSPVTICNVRGRWEGNQLVCRDIEPPRIHDCPNDSVVRIGFKQSHGHALWTEPTATDNYDNSYYVHPVEKQGRGSPMPLSEGIHTFVYTSTDSAGNEATPCSFRIFVQRLYCPRMIPNNGIAMDCPDGFSYGSRCNFTCQHGWNLQGDSWVVCDVNPDVSEFPIWRWRRGPPTCKSDECHPLATPRNGYLSCGVWYVGDFCAVNCDPGHDLSLDPDIEDRVTICQRNGTWTRDHFSCIKSRAASQYVMESEHTYDSEPCCYLDMKSMEDEFSRKYQEAIDGGECGSGSCSFAGIRSSCQGDCASLSRRDTNRYSIAFKSSIKLVVDQDVPINYDQAFTILSSLVNDASDTLQHFTYESLNGYRDFSFDAPLIQCPDGFGISMTSKTCVECEPGSFHDISSGSCIPCPRGQYQSSGGQTECISCPHGTFTKATGSDTLTSCISECQPGLFSSTGLVPCSPCPIGHYSPSPRLASCIPCPPSTWTDHNAASDANSCKEFDIMANHTTPMSYLIAHKSLKVPVRDINFMVRFAQVKVIKELGVDKEVPFLSLRLLSNKSPVGAINLIVSNNMLFGKVELQSWECATSVSLMETSKKWTSLILILDSAGHIKLITNPSDLGQQTTCDWSPIIESDDIEVVFTGKNKDGYSSGVGEITDLNIISGKDVSMNGNYFTSCGFVNEQSANILLHWEDMAASTEWENVVIKTPSDCNVIDECQGSPCKNGATCTDQINGYTCSCAAGFTGDQCEINIDDCPGNMCMKGSTCIDGINTYTCHCDDNSRGEFCEQTIHHGGWSSWAPWEACSVTCGEGVTYRNRFCTDPLPDHDGRMCEGEDVQYDTCKEEKCPECQLLSEPDNADLQCQQNYTTFNCTLSCHDGFIFTSENAEFYICGPDTDYLWNHRSQSNPMNALPRCTEPFAPLGYELMAFMTYDGVGECTAPLERKSEDLVRINAQNIKCISDESCTLSDIQAIKCAPELLEDFRTFYSILDPGLLRDDIDPLVYSSFEKVALVSFTLQVKLDTAGKTSSSQDDTDLLINAEKTINASVKAGRYNIHYNDDIYVVTHLAFDGPNVCPKGCTSRSFDCAPCAGGEFELRGVCFRCPFGQYQVNQGSTECSLCPEGFSTKGPGSQDAGDCTVPCQPGTSSNGTRCQECDIGMYQDMSTQGKCKVCPAGYTTNDTGSIQCDVPCAKGNYGKDGACYPCTYGTYQESQGQGQCVKCPFGHVTDNKGSSNHNMCKFGVVLISIIAVVSILLCIILAILLIVIWRKLESKGRVYPEKEEKTKELDEKVIFSPQPTYERHESPPPAYISQSAASVNVTKEQVIESVATAPIVSIQETHKSSSKVDTVETEKDAMEEMSDLFSKRGQNMPHKAKVTVFHH